MKMSSLKWNQWIQCLRSSPLAGILCVVVWIIQRASTMQFNVCSYILFLETCKLQAKDLFSNCMTTFILMQQDLSVLVCASACTTWCTCNVSNINYGSERTVLLLSFAQTRLQNVKSKFARLECWPTNLVSRQFQKWSSRLQYFSVIWIFFQNISLN